jgi:hypothetical protein
MRLSLFNKRLTFLSGVHKLFHNSAIDRCIDDLSSTLELTQALEQQLELVYKTVSQICEQSEVPDDPRP